MKHTPLLACLSLLAIFQTGCVVGRRSFDLTVPPTAIASSQKGAIAIGDVKDARLFMNRPPDPSTPSIDGDIGTMTEAQKAQMIGRQRNTYGMAMGDVALPLNITIKDKARSLVENGLKHRGYSISGDLNNPDRAEIVVMEFWGWSTPGFVAISFEARVSCTVDVTVGGKAHRIVVNGYGLNHGQMASDANWQKAYSIAFEDFLAKFDAAMAAEGL